MGMVVVRQQYVLTMTLEDAEEDAIASILAVE